MSSGRERGLGFVTLYLQLKEERGKGVIKSRELYEGVAHKLRNARGEAGGTKG